MEKYFGKIFLLVWLLMSNCAMGQRIDQLWMMGADSYAGIPFGGTNMTFQSTGPSITFVNRQMNFNDADRKSVV